MSIIHSVTLPDGNTHNITLPILSSGFTTTAGSSTSGAYLATRWAVSGINGITTPVDGMTIAVRVPLAGSSGGVLLSIDGGSTYYPIVRNVSTLVTTTYEVGSTIILTFNNTQTAKPYVTAGETTTVTGCWQVADYDVNTRTSVGDYRKNGTKLYFVGTTTSDSSSSSSYATSYTNSNIYVTTGNVLYSAKGFDGDLAGNADTATKATQDASGNVITSTYATKTELASEVESALSEAKASGEFKGDKGDTGATGATGAAGVSVSSVKQTTTSTADDGNNIITVTLSNGTTSTFTVQNGSKGSTGAAGSNGSDGYTPVRGTDYWTDADKAEIKSYVDEAILGGAW